MSPLQILHEQISTQTIVITIIGQLDESNVDANAPKIYEYIEEIPDQGNVIFNFAALEYMNSKSIGYTTDFFNKVTEKEGTMIIAEAPEHILDILTVVGLAQVIPFTDTVMEAKAMLADEEGEESSSPEPESEPELTIEEKEEVIEKTEEPEPVVQEEVSPVATEETKNSAMPIIDLAAEKEKLSKTVGAEESSSSEAEKIEEVTETVTQEEEKEPEVRPEIKEEIKHIITEDVKEQVETIKSEEIKNQEKAVEIPVAAEEKTAEKIENMNFEKQEEPKEEEGGIPILTISLVIAIILVLITVFT